MDRGTRTAAAPNRRAGFLLSGVLILALLAGGTLYLARGALFPGPVSGRAPTNSPTMAAGCGAASACTVSPAGVAVAVAPAVVTVPPRQATARTRQAGTKQSPHPASSATGAVGAPSSASAFSPSPRPTASATGGGGTAASAAAGQVLALINQARSAAGLPALTVTSGLEASSSAHNLKMADGCGLSHQCQGEPAIGDRETAAGVHWTAAGENIGDGGPVAGTSAAIAQMAVGLTQSMLDERPPDDGHRMNILSSTFTHIGIAVYRDGSGTVWLTQDFSN
jgi:uncharacterized protein YkwD